MGARVTVRESVVNELNRAGGSLPFAVLAWYCEPAKPGVVRAAVKALGLSYQRDDTGFVVWGDARHTQGKLLPKSGDGV